MMKLAVSKRAWLTQQQLQILETTGYEVQSFLDVLPTEFDVFAGYPEILRDHFKDLPDSLRYIHLLSAGYDKLDMNEVFRLGIRLTNSRGVYSVPIAEYIVQKILFHAKCGAHFIQQQAQHCWYRYQELQELTNLTAGFLGTGDIAQKAAERLKPFGIRILGLNTTGHAQASFQTTYAISKLDQLLPQCDYVVNCLPLTAATEQLLNMRHFLMMKEDAVFISVGRGKTVAEDELKTILNRHLSMVYMDVFEEEPLSQDDWKWSHPKMMVTPHIAFASKEAEKRKQELVFCNLLRYIQGEQLIEEVQAERSCI